MSDSTLSDPPSPLVRFRNTLLQPRASSRDEAFRERIIRAVLTLLALLSIGVLGVSLLFQNSWEAVIVRNLAILLIVLCAASAFAISRQRITTAGALLVFIFLVSGVCLLLQGIVPFGAELALPTFMIALLSAAIVLPRSTILPLAVLIAILVAVTLEISDRGLLNNSGQFIAGLFLIGVEAFFLYQLKTEFDNRLVAINGAVEETEKLRADVELAKQVKGQFLNVVSHELRTPLGAVISYTEIMLSGMAGTFTEKQTQLQNNILSNAKRLLALINDLLNYVNVASGANDIVVTLESPRKIIGGLVDGMHSQAQEKSITLTATFEESMPEAVLVDVGKLQQIVTTLLETAIKYTSEGGVEVKVGSAQAKTWQIKVIDTGRGIPADDAKVIFESFQHIYPADPRELKGTGFELAITKGLVDKLEGTIEVQSEDGKGSTFTVTLPCRVKDAAQRHAEKQSEPLAS